MVHGFRMLGTSFLSSELSVPLSQSAMAQEKGGSGDTI